MAETPLALVDFRPVDQTTFGNPHGDCMAACVSSITGIPRDEIHDALWTAEDHWWNGLRRALARHGWDATICYQNGPDGCCPQGYAIAGGSSPRADGDPDHPGHAVVYLDGRMIHDPHPDRTGLAGPVEEWYILLPPRRDEPVRGRGGPPMIDRHRLHREVEARTALEIAQTPHAELLVGAAAAAVEAIIREDLAREIEDARAEDDLRAWIRDAVEEARRG